MTEEKKLKRPRGTARLIPGKCIACGARCQSACPKDAVEMNDRGEPVIKLEKCIGCRRCIKECPAAAIEIYFTPEEQNILAQMDAASTKTAITDGVVEDQLPDRLREYHGVWVFVEQTEGEVATVSWELLGIGAQLAKARNTELCAVILGDKIGHLCPEAFAYGADKVYLMDNPIFRFYRTQPYNEAVCYLIDKYKPEILLTGATGLGRDLASAVATRMNTGLTADCTGLAIDEKGFLLQTRPAFGGNIMATILTENTRPQMSTVRPHVMPLPERNTGRKGTIIKESIPAKEDDFVVKVLQIIDERKGRDGVDVSKAEVIVSGGRGMCAKENFTVLEELALELGGVVGCSRGAVEAGWMPVERQVGQTGKTVRPKIYFACGISGAIQHLVGMQDSDVIIAINQDKKAPIFEVCTYGIVGDVMQIVPAITSRIKELRAEKKRSYAS